jgi:hypothetical protein
MGLERTTAAIRIFGDDLDPDDVTALLGVTPTEAYRKGEPFSPRPGSGPRPKSSWHLRSEDASPGDLDRQIAELLSRTTDDPAIWLGINARHQADVFVGLFMGTVNDMFALEAETLAALARRGLTLVFDVYDPLPEDDGQA